MTQVAPTPTSAARITAFALLALTLGAGLAVLCLEFIGVPLLIATVLLGRAAPNRPSADMALPRLAFGVGFTGSVAWFAVRTSGIFDGSANSGSLVWFGFWLLLGCMLVSVEAAALIRSGAGGAAREDRPGV
jgi:hypothetical protein